MNKQTIWRSLRTAQDEMSFYPHIVKEEYNRCISQIADLCLANIDDQVAGAMDDIVAASFSTHDHSEIEYAYKEVKALFEHTEKLYNLVSTHRSNLSTIVSRIITEKNEGN